MHVQEPDDVAQFAPLFWCQLCSALNDNFLKNALAMLILFGLGGAGGGHGRARRDADHGVRHRLHRPVLHPVGARRRAGRPLRQGASSHNASGSAEIPIAALAATGFFLHSVPILFVALGLFGVMAALFGPVKYGILPEKLETAELPAGNALVEGATFLAILMGTIAGGIAVAEAESARYGGRRHPGAGNRLLGFRPHHPGRRPFRAGPRHHRQPLDLDAGAAARAEDRTGACGAARTSCRGSGWSASWRCRCCPPSSRRIVGGTEGVVTMCLAVFTVGIAIGSALAARASHGQPNLALVPLGARADGAIRAGHRLGRLGPGARSLSRSVLRSCLPRVRGWPCSFACAAWRSPAVSSSCRRLPPCRRGRPWTGARA